jgi:alginate O-acetyltransferase complex protein AlgI
LINAVFILLVLLILLVFSNYHTRFGNSFICSIAFIVGLLLFSKCLSHLGSYFQIPHFEGSFLSLAAPIGISFYSLQAIAYIVDVRDGRIAPEKNILKLSAFLAFFPQALAGPIHRPEQLMPQLHQLTLPSSFTFFSAIKMMLWGYFCKLIIADKIALIVNPILSNPQSENGLSLAISAVLYSFQIYFDFFGYTLIAIGMGSMLGIKLNENFNRPYSANSFREFWRRWHITLSTWLRDYVYLRLGGRQNSYVKFCLILILTFLLSGAWHGLTPNFILWGLLHATFYIIEDLLSKLTAGWRIGNYVILRFAKKVVFFTLITLSWLVFRTTDMEQLRFTVTKIFSVGAWSTQSLLAYVGNIYFVFLLLIGGILFSNLNNLVKTIIANQPKNLQEQGVEGLYVITCFLLIFIFGDLGTQEFLYFNF